MLPLTYQLVRLINTYQMDDKSHQLNKKFKKSLQPPNFFLAYFLPRFLTSIANAHLLITSQVSP